MDITQITPILAPAQSQTKGNITRDGGLISSQQRGIKDELHQGRIHQGEQLIKLQQVDAHEVKTVTG